MQFSRVSRLFWLPFAFALSTAFLVCGGSTAHADPEKRISLSDLDQIVTRGGTLTGFLSSAALKEEYFRELEAYFGADRFSKKAYQKIIDQLQEMNRKFPEVAERAWQTEGLGQAYSVTVKVKASGLVLKKGEFDQWIATWKNDLTLAAAIPENETQIGAREKKDPVTALRDKIADFYQQAERFNRAERAQKSGVFFESLRKDPDFKRIVAGAYLDWISNEQIGDQLRTGDADLILLTFERLRRHKKFALGGQPLPQELQSLIAREAPTLETPPLILEKDKPASTRFFTVETVTTRRGRVIPVGQGSQMTYHFLPAPRRIHTLFKGIPIAECVAGNDATLNSLTPERTLTGFLENTEFHHIEKETEAGGIYQGFVQNVGGTIAGTRYGSIDLGAPLFARKIVADGETIPVGALFFDLWLPEAIKVLPKEQKGLVISESNSVDNSGVLPSIRKRPAYLFGEFAGLGDRFVIQDDLAKKIAALGIREGYAADYAGRMIFDAVVPDAGKLTVLNPKATRFPDRMSLTEVLALLIQVRGTAKDPILGEQLIPLVQEASDAEREAFAKAASADRINPKSALLWYESAASQNLSPLEESNIKSLGKSGSQILIQKNSASIRQIAFLLDTLDDRAEKLGKLIGQIKKIPDHLSELAKLLKQPGYAVNAALALQKLKHASLESDSVIAIALRDPQSETTQKILLYLGLATGKASQALREAVVEFGVVSSSSDIADASRVYLSNLGPPDADLTSRLLTQMEIAPYFHNRMRIAGIFLDHSRTQSFDIPWQAEWVYLSAIGNERWKQDSILSMLGQLPRISKAALQKLAEKLPDYSREQKWEVAKALAKAKNLNAADVRDVFSPYLNHEGESMRLTATRILAAHGLGGPRVESVIWEDFANTWERLQNVISKDFRWSPQSIEKLLIWMANRTAESGARQLLSLPGVTFSTPQIQQIRDLQSSWNRHIRYDAAVLLLEHGLADGRTLSILVEMYGDRSYDQEKVTERIRKAFELVQNKSARNEALLKLYWRNGEMNSSLAELFSGFSKSTLDLSRLSELKLVQTLLDPKFSDPLRVYQLLKKSDKDLESAPYNWLAKNFESISGERAFYAALLLQKGSHRTWTFSIQKALFPYYWHSDIKPASWDASFVLEIATKLTDIESRSSEERNQIKKILILAPAPLLQDANLNSVLKKLATTENSLFQNRAREVLSEWSKRTPQISPAQKKKSDWLVDLENGTDLTDAAAALFKLKLSQSDQKRLLTLLSSEQLHQRIAAAILLAKSGVWSEEVQTHYLAALWENTDWNRDFLIENLKGRPLAQKARLTAYKKFEGDQANYAVQSLQTVRLGRDGLAELRTLQNRKTGAHRIRAFAAAVLLLRNQKDSRTIETLIRSGAGQLSSNWLGPKLATLQLTALDLRALQEMAESQQKAKRDWAQTLITQLKLRTPTQISAWQEWLESPNEWLRVNAAAALRDESSDEPMTSTQEKVIVDALISPKWDKEYFFEQLEHQTSLHSESQVLMATELARNPPQKNTYVVHLLMNQLTLAPEAEHILRSIPNNSLVRDILASKRSQQNAIMDQNADCGDHLL